MPLLGAIGNASEYAYRGNLDDWPDEFLFVDISNANPGTSYTSGITTITGINYKAKVSISGVGSFSVNGGAFDTSAKFIRNNDIVSIKIDTTSGSLDDFSKTYVSSLTVGKRTSDWILQTRSADISPDTGTLVFNTLIDREVGTAYTSNQVTLSGLESGIPIPISIVSGVGSFSINGSVSFFTTGTIQNGDTLFIKQTSSQFYNTQQSTTVLVGSFSTTFSIVTRNVDLTADAFTFTDQTGVAFNTDIESNAIVVSGIDTGFSGVATVTGSVGAEIRIEDSLGNVILPYTSSSLPVENGNRLRTRVRSSTSGSTETTSTVAIGSTSDTFSVTTRVPIVDSIPNQFTFTDVTNQPLNTAINSNSITLSGMTSGALGTASITNGTFSVTRSGSTVSSLTSYSVQNGDVITLRTTTPSAVEQSKDVIFSISGSDNTILPGTNATISDTWNVRTLERDCLPNNFSSQTYVSAEPGVVVGFGEYTATGFESGCSVKITTDNPSSSYIQTATQTGNSVSINPNETFAVYVTASSSFSGSVSANITLKSDFRPSGVTFNNTVNTRARDLSPTFSAITAGPGDQINPSNDDNASDGFWTPSDPNNTAFLKYRSVRPQEFGGPQQHNWYFTLSGFDYVPGMAFRWEFTGDLQGPLLFGEYAIGGQFGWYGGDVRSGPDRGSPVSSTYANNVWIVPTSNFATGYMTLQAPPFFRPALASGDNVPLDYQYFSSVGPLAFRLYDQSSVSGVYIDRGIVTQEYSFAIRSSTQDQYNNRIADGRWLP